jgi:ADP-heptose:LPS heptosyltransferase
MSNILIIKLGALGDVIMSTSLINQIRKHHANDSLWLITSPAYADIFEQWKELKVVTFDRKHLVDNLKIIFWTRKMKFDRVYDLQSNDRTSIICALSGINNIIGNHPRYPYNTHPQDKYAGQCHIYDRMLEVLASAGINTVHAPPQLMVSEQGKTRVFEWLNNHGLQHGKFVILHAGASSKHPEKCWPYFEELAKTISQSGYKIIWAGSDTDAEKNKKLAEKTGIDASGVFSITDLAELGKHARFAVTNDSGPMHILSASGIPVFAFFGPTNWRRNHAIGQAENVICAQPETVKEFIPGSLDKITIDQALANIRSKGLI